MTIKPLSEKIKLVSTEEDMQALLQDICVQHTELAREWNGATLERREEIEHELAIIKKAERTFAKALGYHVPDEPDGEA